MSTDTKPTARPKHTPEPWIDDECPDSCGYITIRPRLKDGTIDIESQPIAAVERDRLKAANAELLAALKAMVHHLGILEDNDMIHPVARAASKKARAAIAKAAP